MVQCNITKFSAVPTMILIVIIMRVDLIRPFTPSSFHKTINVAIHGNDMANNVVAINNCFAESASGASMPTATSFLKKPIIRATIASFGKPNKPLIIGANIPVTISNNLKYKRILITRTPIKTIGTASNKKPWTRKYNFLVSIAKGGNLYGGISIKNSGLYPGSIRFKINPNTRIIMNNTRYTPPT